jgi:hypothetical protein
MTQHDLWGEKRIHIPENPLLEGICNHILYLTDRDKGLLDGNSVGEIDRKLTLNIWLDEGLKNFIPEDMREAFAEWFKNPKHRPDEEAISRARRYLAERDLIRLPAKAIQSAEQHRQRIARSVKR